MVLCLSDDATARGMQRESEEARVNEMQTGAGSGGFA